MRWGSSAKCADLQRKVAGSAVVACALSLVAACGGDTGSVTTSPPTTSTASSGKTPAGEAPEDRVDVTALTATTVCDAMPVAEVSKITGREVSHGKGEVGACNWKAPEAIRIRIYPPAEWSPHGDSGMRDLSGIGNEAYVAKGSFGNGYVAEALFTDRAVAAIIPAGWATEEMAIELLRAAAENLG